MPAGDSMPLFITAISDEDLNADTCNKLPDDTPDLSQFMVLTKESSCLIDNLKAKNATRFLYSLVQYNFTDDRIENDQNSTFSSLNSEGNVSCMSKYMEPSNRKLR